ncbi:hypothetical protein BDB01DRAFT_788787 [Pilobolus umbonatus]|nr:hypothetical protein BDB01DRAFT_788787 [Pilobolus umbonatus]
MHYLHDEQLSQGSLSSSSSTYSSSCSSDDFSNSPFTLHQVLSNPKLLCAFECFLRQSWSHECLLFIEAITQLKHESDQKAVEATLHRIYKTFLARGSPLELNVTTQDQVRDDIRSLQWAIVDRVDAVTILEETEAQVLGMLKAKLMDFVQTMELPTGNISPTIMDKQQTSVVIVGGGFTGFTVASILDQMPRFYVTLIDTKDSFEYTPGIVKKIVNPDGTTSLRVRHDAYVKNGRVLIGYAEELTNGGKGLIVNGETLTFDYLVVATGSAYSSQLKSTDTSSLYRMSGLEESYLELLKARKVLIIGGGLVGCELASEISQHQFPGAYPKKHITIVDSHKNVVNRSEPRQQAMARKYLEDLSVEIICNEKIISFNNNDDNVYLGSSGRVYAGYDKVFIATGTRPNSSIFASSSGDSSLDSCIDAWGRIKVKSTLQIDHYKHKHIFAGGDVTNVVEEKTGYAATISGVCIARNICRMVKGKHPLKQGTKGTLPAPDKPLHGMLEHGGIGKQNLNSIKKRFSFLNPSWAALKYFDEQQFLRIVQGQGSINSSQVLGRLPRKLNLPTASVSSSKVPGLQHYRTKSQSTVNSSTRNLNSSSQSSLRSMSSGRLKSPIHSTSNIERTPNRYESLKNKPSDPKQPVKNRHPLSRHSSTRHDSISGKSVDEGLIFERFTYGGEDISLFNNDSTITTGIAATSTITTTSEIENVKSSLDSPPQSAAEKRDSRMMSYDKDFKLSPPPKRRSSLTTSFDSMTFYSTTQNVRLTRSSSFSSIVNQS